MKPMSYHESIATICAEQALSRFYPKGAMVVMAGDDSDTVYFIQEGELKVCAYGDDGKEVIFNVLVAGESFGELAVFTGEPRSADVVCRTSCKLMVLKKSDYLDALRSNADLAIAALEYQAHLVYRLAEQVSSLALVNVFGRVSRLLKNRGVAMEEGLVIEGLTHQDIASEVGASREMVSKILSDLNKGDYIHTQRKRIVLLKPLPKGW